MVASTDLVSAPTSTNPFVSALTGSYIFRPGYAVTYVLQGNPGDTSPHGGARWAQANAAHAFELAAQAWAAVANISIAAASVGYDGTGSTAAYTWVEKLGDLGSDTLGEHSLPSTGAMYGEFNNGLALFTAANNAVGGYSFATFLHEIGHGLGLAHPHEPGNAFPGVTGEFSLGTFGENQLLYTVMSYNDGSESLFTPSDAYGWSATPMAFDIAAIQHLYGANMSTGSGDNVYRLPVVNGGGTGWSCIWDAGGTDTISAADTGIGSTIDLRAATLMIDGFGGGYLSRAGNVAGGFTIANGVTIENAVGSTGEDTIHGNEAANRLIGNGGQDGIFGFGGNDRIEGSGELSGGDGDDTIIASGVNNNVRGDAGEDRLEGIGRLDGGDGNDILTGGSGGDNVYGGLYGGAGDDQLYADNGSNAMYGGAGIDTMVGGNGNDTLDGGAGGDVMSGGLGDDTYVIDDAGDRVVELGGGGTDIVQSYFDYVLAASIENGRLLGTAPLRLVGNAGANMLSGNAAANVIDGGAGADTMAGGLGDDTYHVDSIDDVVLEYAYGGFDTVYSAVSYTLPNLPPGDPYAGAGVPTPGQKNEIEQLTLTGAGNLTGTGNDFANAINGNGGDNFLFGMSGDDVLDGGAGADTIDGGAGADRLLGGSGADRLSGGAGNDVLVGGAGNDVLDGGADLDSVGYASAFRTYGASWANGATTLRGGAGEGIDTLTGVEQVAFVDGVLVSDANSAGAQVQRMYDTVLGRGPDPVGLDYWVDRMEDGLVIGAVAQAIASSAEFQQATGGLGNAGFVDYVYVHALGRGADPGGRDYWIGRIEAGLSRGDMLVNFSESGEHRARTADLVDRGYFQTDDFAQAVALLYDSFTGRLPDLAGLTFWTGQLKTGGYALPQVADAFAASGEFQAAVGGKNNGELVDFMYMNTLDRGPDGGGRAFWVDQLDHGLTQGQLLLAFSQSAEHAALMAPHILYGIDVLI